MENNGALTKVSKRVKSNTVAHTADGGSRTVRSASVTALLLLLSIVLTVILTGCGTEDVYTDYDIEMDKLVYQKNKLLSEIGDIESEANAVKGNTSYIGFIFTTLDSELYSSAYRIMSQKDPIGETVSDAETEQTVADLPCLVGSVALSPSELPGLDGKITMAELDEMIGNGWSVVLFWDGEGDLGEYIDGMASRLESLGFDLPSTLIFKENTYSPDYDAVLLDHGIENAIHHGENEMPLIENTVPDGVWHPGSVAWKSGMPATILRRSIETDGGYGFLEISFAPVEDSGYYAYSEYKGEENVRLSSFEKMISVISTSVKNGDVEVLSPDDTRYKVEKYYIDGVDIDIEYEKKKASLEAELKEIEKRIDELYREYQQGGN